jgi:hypothetical protein
LIFTPAYKSGNIYDTNEYIVAMGPTWLDVDWLKYNLSLIYDMCNFNDIQKSCCHQEGIWILHQMEHGGHFSR